MTADRFSGPIWVGVIYLFATTVCAQETSNPLRPTKKKSLTKQQTSDFDYTSVHNLQGDNAQVLSAQASFEASTQTTPNQLPAPIERSPGVTPSTGNDVPQDALHNSVGRFEIGNGFVNNEDENCESNQPCLGIDRVLWPAIRTVDQARYFIKSNLPRRTPLQGTNWTNRPFHIGWFVGSMQGDTLIANRIDQGTGIIGGYRVGWEKNNRWGFEGRVAFSHLDLTDGRSPPTPRTDEVWFWDVSVSRYLWGNSKWRPYASIGVGTASFDFLDDQLQPTDETLIHFPASVGLKYYYRNWLTLRMELTDNFALGNDVLESMHNFSATAGVEVRLGGRRKAYYGW